METRLLPHIDRGVRVLRTPAFSGEASHMIGEMIKAVRVDDRCRRRRTGITACCEAAITEGNSS
jgi:hypothetical protein